jgi:hypothetical protein
MSKATQDSRKRHGKEKGGSGRERETKNPVCIYPTPNSSLQNNAFTNYPQHQEPHLATPGLSALS